jgi:pectate lyase
MPINQESPEEAYQAVLEHVGCSLPNRDTIDARIIEEVRKGTATYGNNGIITTPADVGGWPELKSSAAPADSDHDGMPNEWELRYGLNPDDSNDGNEDANGDGYTNLEHYLAHLAGELTDTSPVMAK